MGMFGSMANALKGFSTPGTDGVSGADKLALIASSFGDPESFASGQKLYAGKKAQAKQQGMMQQLLDVLGPQYATSAPLDVSTAPIAARGQTPAVNLGGSSGGFMSQDTLPTSPTPPPGSIVEFPMRGSAQTGPTTFQMPQQVSGGMNINDPRLARMAFAATGGDMNMLLDILKAQKPSEPKVIEGPDGIYREQSDHSFQKVTPYTPPPTFGWEVGPGGNLQPRKGGPADPDYIARTAGVRRDAIVSRPTPSHARASSVSANAIKWD